MVGMFVRIAIFPLDYVKEVGLGLVFVVGWNGFGFGDVSEVD